MDAKGSVEQAIPAVPAAASASTAAEEAKRLLEAVRDWNGGPVLADDAACLALECCPGGSARGSAHGECRGSVRWRCGRGVRFRTDRQRAPLVTRELGTGDFAGSLVELFVGQRNPHDIP